MKSSLYFKHDLDARADEKMRAMIIKHGATGYGIYWMVIEDLYRNKGRLNRDYKALSWAYHQPQPKVKAVVEDFDAFYDAKGKIACRRVDRGLSELKRFREQARLAGRQGGLKRAARVRLGSATQNPSKERIGEERKGEREESAGNPTLLEIEGYIKTTGSAVDPQRFFSVNQARGWMIGATPIADWKALLLTWEKTEKRESPKVSEDLKKKKCQNPTPCGLAGNWIAGRGADGTELCAACLNEEAVNIERGVAR